MESNDKKLFYRKVYTKMLNWKDKYAPDYVLFLQGARRVGKTTLAEKLGQEEYRSFLTISFDKAPTIIKNLFVDSLEDLDTFFNQLQIHYKKKLYPRNSLIILDEIQLFPLARQALKTLLLDKRYDYLETGSLATIKKRTSEILVPSEEYPVEVNPLDFEEYLIAKGDDFTFDLMKQHFASLKPLGSLNQSIMHTFREYLLIGGMPQAISAYLKSHDFGDVDFVKQRILDLYEGDIAFQEEENPKYIKSVLAHIPSELSKHDKSYVLSHIDTNARLRDYKGPLNWLVSAMITNIAENVNDPSAAFQLSTIDPSFKCYLLDTGLLISLAYKNQNYLDNELYQAILFDKLHVNEGMIIENMIAQTLKAKGDLLFYYKKSDKELKKVILEIDFLIRRKNKIIPIEVKSSDAESITSLKKFKEMFSNKTSTQYVLYEGDIKRNGEIIYLPYYMAILL